MKAVDRDTRTQTHPLAPPSVSRSSPTSPLLTFAVLLVITAGGCARPRITWTDILYAEDRGNLDAQHRAVVQLDGGCSGTLVTPSRVLTAAHCVTRPGPLPTVFIGTIGSTVEAAFETDRCYLHPMAYEGDARCGVEPPGDIVRPHDLAMLYLRQAVPPGIARPHPALVASPIPNDAWVERSVRLVGWHRWPQRVGQIRRYSGVHRITAFGEGLLVTQPGQDARVFATRQGNSGGPALVDIGGEPVVAGVLSGGSGLGHLGPRFSVYAPTFEPTNAVWMQAHLHEIPGLASR